MNLLVSKTNVNVAKDAYKELLKIVNRDQIIILPQKYMDTPSVKEIALVADNKPFQCTSCLTKCKKSPDFVSVSWDKKVSFCSYSNNKSALSSLDYKGLLDSLSQIQWCDYSCMKSTSLP